jgi:hypothetical protein
VESVSQSVSLSEIEQARLAADSQEAGAALATRFLNSSMRAHCPNFELGIVSRAPISLKS